MFVNYLKIAWRNLLKNKTFSFINIAGLAIGLSCFLLIALYVTDELSYDRHNEKADRIYRVDSDIRFGGTDLKLAVCSDPMGPTLKKDYPQVEQFVRFYNSAGSKMLKKGDQFINEQNVFHADSTLFEVFTLPAVEGDTRTALNEPNTVVLTESAAKKYFGTTNVTGKFIETAGDKNNLYKITAVIKDIPKNSHFTADFIFSMDNVDYTFGNFTSHNFQTYVLLQKGTDPKAFEKNFDEVIAKHVLPQVRQFIQVNSMDEFRKAGNNLAYTLMPLKDIHLRSNRAVEMGVNGNIQYVYIFSAVALFILLIACINFMNLSTARSANRAREVGIRKVLGTAKKSLVWQFLTESTLMAFISLLLAVLIAGSVMSIFNDVAAKSLTIASLFSMKVLPLLLLLPFVVGALAGSYPAFYLSSFQPIKVLKGKINAGFKKSSLRSGLVVFQFAISIIFIIATVIVYNQLDYIQNRKIGFNKDQVLVINGTGTMGDKTRAFKNELSKMPGVISVTNAGFLPVANSARNDNTFSPQPVMNAQNGFNMQTWRIDQEYLATLGMELKAGRNFSRDFGTDSMAIIINETTANLLGPGNPLGKKLYTPGNTSNPTDLEVYTVIGVVKDFNFASLHNKVSPLSFRLGRSDWAIACKVKAGTATNLVTGIEKAFKASAPGMPFSYEFLDDSFDKMYRAEQRVGKIAIAFAILTILIATLGLFGLATYMAEQRTREIGVRKVLGASVANLTAMLSLDFLKLVGIAALVAFPFAWFAMHKWLEDFAFRVEINWWVFVLAALAALMTALLTVSFQAIKAALANPVKSLRTE
ncbi:MAG: ABC transporter permease [Bacteroidota bacterium]